jgi:hypothetical protein
MIEIAISSFHDSPYLKIAVVVLEISLKVGSDVGAHSQMSRKIDT